MISQLSRLGMYNENRKRLGSRCYHLSTSYFLPSTPLSSDASLTASEPESALILTAGLSSLPCFLISFPRLEMAIVSPSLTSITLPSGSEEQHAVTGQYVSFDWMEGALPLTAGAPLPRDLVSFLEIIWIFSHFQRLCFGLLSRRDDEELGRVNESLAHHVSYIQRYLVFWTLFIVDCINRQGI